MFSSSPNYTKLKTNLRLALNRLKLLEKKKAELAQKARKEIGDYLATDKIERAKIRVEHIIREDYLVEAMEILEIYCDLLLARFGLVTQMKELDDGIAEAVSTMVWVCPRLQNDIPELKVISDTFVQKYGPQFAENSRTATGDHFVSQKLMHKLQLQAPPKLLVEKYLIEIAKNYNITYEPDPQVMKDEKEPNHYLIDLSDRNNGGGGGGADSNAGAPPQMGFIGYPAIPPLPQPPSSNMPFNYPPPYGGGGGGVGAGAGKAGFKMPSYPSFNNKNPNANFIKEESNDIPASASAGFGSPDDSLLHTKLHDPPPRYSSINQFDTQNKNKPQPQPRTKLPPPTSGGGGGPSAPPAYIEIPDLPSVPSDLPDAASTDGSAKPDDDEIDFDDLSRRFANLKKRR